MTDSKFVRRNVEQELPHGVPADMAMMAMPDDERYWVDDGRGFAMRSLWINPASGSRISMIRLKRNGIVGIGADYVDTLIR